MYLQCTKIDICEILQRSKVSSIYYNEKFCCRHHTQQQNQPHAPTNSMASSLKEKLVQFAQDGDHKQVLTIADKSMSYESSTITLTS
jgi:hypothetical protein